MALRTRGRVLVSAGRCIDERWVILLINHSPLDNRPHQHQRPRLCRARPDLSPPMQSREGPRSVPNAPCSLLHGLCPGKLSTNLIKTSQSLNSSVFPRP